MRHAALPTMRKVPNVVKAAIMEPSAYDVLKSAVAVALWCGWAISVIKGAPEESRKTVPQL